MISVLLYCTAVMAILVLYFFYRPVESGSGKDETSPGGAHRYTASLSSSPSFASNPVGGNSGGGGGGDNENLSLTRSLVGGHPSRRIVLKQIETQYSASNRSNYYDAAYNRTGTSTVSRLRRHDSFSSTITSASSVSGSSSTGGRVYSDLADSYYLVTRIKRFYAKLTAVYMPYIFKYLGVGYADQGLLGAKSDSNSNDSLVNSVRPTSNLISDNYRNLDELVSELVRLELINPFLNELGAFESRCCFNIIIGIDFTASNEWKGRKTFNSQSLHKTLGNKIYNPYQKVISILGLTLQKLVSATSSQSGGGKAAGSNFLGVGSSASTYSSSPFKIHCYGFGDSKTADTGVFSLFQPLPASMTIASSLDDASMLQMDANYSVDSFEDVLNR